jgi:hypothetical protein
VRTVSRARIAAGLPLTVLRPELLGPTVDRGVVADAGVGPVVDAARRVSLAALLAWR